MAQISRDRNSSASGTERVCGSSVDANVLLIEEKTKLNNTERHTKRQEVLDAGVTRDH